MRREHPTRSTGMNRRALLRGAGVSLTLPWLESVAARGASRRGDEGPPQRLAVLFMPNGVHPDQWTPTGSGTEFEWSPTLEPLKELRDQVNVVSNLWNKASNTGDGHYVKTSGFLTCTTINKTVGVDLNSNGVSMDQVAAQSLGATTPLPSLELGTEPVHTGVDTNVGYTRVYGAHVSWKSPTSPLAKEISPRLVFERLMRATKGGGRESRLDQSILDLVSDDARRLRGQIGQQDRQRMDEYLQSVRSLEQRLEKSQSTDPGAWQLRAPLTADSAPPDRPPEDHAEHVRLMMDMIALAFQTDLTRVVTFMFGNSVSNKNFSFLDGVDGAHHSLSHHQNEEKNLEQYQKINRWHISEYAYLLQRLKEMPEGESSVLDNSMILFGSGLRDGNRHDPHNLPIVVGGRAGGRLQTGQHVVCDQNTPLANLYLTMLQAAGVSQDRFADSQGVIPELVGQPS